MGGSWSQGAAKSSGGRRCLPPTAGSADPFGLQQGIPAIVSRMAGPVHRINPSAPRGAVDRKLIPGAPNQDGLRPRLPPGLRPEQGFDPRSIRSPRVVDVKQQLRTLETQFRPMMNQESPALGLSFGSPSSSGLQMSPEAPNEDQMDIDFILHQPSPATGPTFTIEILGEQGMLTHWVNFISSILFSRSEPFKFKWAIPPSDSPKGAIERTQEGLAFRPSPLKRSPTNEYC